MILIVDDKQENLFSLKTVLEKHGFEADTAISGEEALRKLLQREYVLVILDVQMPGMDGFEVAEAITGLNRTKDIPIIFLSAVNTHKRFITRGFESGAVDYLTKPVDPDILILKVRNFFRLYENNKALKEAEKALSATVGELHNILESLPQLAFTANPRGEIVLVNRPWFEFSDSRHHFPEVRPGAPSLEDSWRTLIRAGMYIEAEVCIRRLSDGQYLYHLLRATPVKVNGQLVRWVGSLTSIHEQKTLNELLERKVAERTRELLEINRALEITNDDLQQFTSVASHDLKEPLRKIQFYGHLIQDSGALEGKLSAHLDKIIRSSARMNDLINDLLSFSRLSEADLFQPTDLNSIIGEIRQDLELAIEEKAATIEVEPLPQLEVIPSLIRQLFQNLLSNALKFSQPDRSPHIRIWAELPGANGLDSGYCLFYIADNGIGFDEQYKDKIFSLFQRLNAREAYEGTGIGLTIAKKIVDKHNGSITARSRPGEGATFIITLPLRQQPAENPTPHSMTLNPRPI